MPSPTTPLTHAFHTCGCLHIPSPPSPSPSSHPLSNGARTRTRLVPTLCPTHHAIEPPKTWWAECVEAEERAEAAWRERGRKEAKTKAREPLGEESAGECSDMESKEKGERAGVGTKGQEDDGEDVKMGEEGVEKDVGEDNEVVSETEEGIAWHGRGESEVVVPWGKRVLQRRKMGMRAPRGRGGKR